MRNNSSFAAALLAASTMILMPGAEACVQAELLSVKNTNGVITDYESPEDELAVYLGVSNDVMIVWSNTMTIFQERFISSGSITMPCFNDSVLWIEIEEQDNSVVDFSQMAMACKNLQIGVNDIVMHITEDNSGIANAADVAKSTLGTSFSFGSGENDKTAQYTFKFNVTQNCDLPTNQKQISDATSGVNWYSEDIATVLMPKMEAEYVAPPAPPAPVVVVPVPVVVPEPIPEPVVLPVVVPEPVVEPVVVVPVVVPEPIVEPIIPEPIVEPEPVIVPVAPVPEPELIVIPEPVVEPEPVVVEPEPVPEPAVVVPEPAEKIVEPVVEPTVEPEDTTPEPSNNDPLPVIDNFNKDLLPDFSTDGEPAPITSDSQVVLQTGDTINLKEDVDSTSFSQFTTFKSTQDFFSDFASTDDLLRIKVTEEEVVAEDKGWLEQDDMTGMPNWVFILICCVAVIFALLGVYICFQMRKNQGERGLQERAIIRELALAKSEGAVIPDDLEKRLERFQDCDENGKKIKGGDALAKSNGGSSSKVHPLDTPVRGQRNMTRYTSATGSNASQNIGLSMSMQKLIREEDNRTNQNKGKPGRNLTRNQMIPGVTPFMASDKESVLEMTKNGGAIIEQPFEDHDFASVRNNHSIAGLKGPKQPSNDILADVQVESMADESESERKYRPNINDI